jgi:hypothetical protein
MKMTGNNKEELMGELKIKLKCILLYFYPAELSKMVKWDMRAQLFR